MSANEKNLQVVNGTRDLSQSLSQFGREEIDTIKRTVARGVSDAELSMFLTICGRYQLDPFLKEIWCYKRQKKDQSTGRYVDDPNAPAIITTSRDGYLKVAQRDDNFDGIKSFVVKEGDTFEIDAENDKVLHKFGTKRGKILGAWAAVYHKSRRPVIVYAEFDEYNAKTNTWNNYPSAMIQKVAEALALKRQFGISGLVTQEEMEVTNAIDAEYSFIGEPRQPQKSHFDKNAWLTAINNLNTLAQSLGVNGDQLKALGHTEFGKGDPKTWDMDDIQHLNDFLKKYQPIDAKEEETSNDGPHEDADGLPDDNDLPF